MRIGISILLVLTTLGLVTIAEGSGIDDDQSGSRQALDVDKVEAKQRKEMCEYLTQAGRPPTEYIVSKFSRHDLVIVGENHQIHENCRLIADMIEMLYQRAGVRLLLSEFVRNRNTERLNGLLTAEKWNEQAILEIMRDWAWPTWGFKEYRDIFHAAWRCNQNRPEKATPFRVVGLDNDWDQWEYGWQKKSKMEQFQDRLAREEHLVAVAEREVFGAEQKALVHIGYSHSLTGHGLRFGTVLTKNHGDRVFQVVLHPELPARRGTAQLTKLLESLWNEAGAKPVGFDVKGSPLSVLRDRECVFWNYLKNGHFEELAQGYIVLAPVDKLNKVTWIPGFISEAQFERALAVALAARWTNKGECQTAEDLDRCMQQHFPGPGKD